MIGGAIDTNGVVAEDEGRLKVVNAKFAGLHREALRRSHGPAVAAGSRSWRSNSPISSQRTGAPARFGECPAPLFGNPQAASDASSLLLGDATAVAPLGHPESEIERIEKSGEVSKTLTLPLRSPALS